MADDRRTHAHLRSGVDVLESCVIYLKAVHAELEAAVEECVDAEQRLLDEIVSEQRILTEVIEHYAGNAPTHLAEVTLSYTHELPTPSCGAPGAGAGVAAIGAFVLLCVHRLEALFDELENMAGSAGVQSAFAALSAHVEAHCRHLEAVIERAEPAARLPKNA